MEIKKICLLGHPKSTFGVIEYFERELKAALERKGVEVLMVFPQHENAGTFLDQIMSFKPDCTLSFNGLLPDSTGRFLCDLIKIPHVCYLINSPVHFLSLLKTPLNIIACADRDYCSVFHEHGFPHLIFLPHATSVHLEHVDSFTRDIEVLVLSTFFDFGAIKNNWSKKFSPQFQQVLQETIAKTLGNWDHFYLHSFVQTLDQHLREGAEIDPKDLDYQTLLDEIETYIQGSCRVKVISSLNASDVQVFGRKEKGDWSSYFQDKPNVHLNDAVPFLEALELMKRAKIVVDCSPVMKQGLPDGVINGLACGAVVFALDAPYVREQFIDGQEIMLYSFDDLEKMNDSISLCLKDERKRLQIARKGREKILRNHTWDERAQTLINQLPKYLEKIHTEMTSM